MMYEEFRTIWMKVAPNRPMPSIEAYHETIEPFYMAANLDKDEFVRLYTKMPVVVASVAKELYQKDAAIFAMKKAAEDAKRETVRNRAAYNETIDAMEKRQKELEEIVTETSKANKSLGTEVAAARSEIDALRKRHASLIRGLCDKCLEKVLFN